MILFKQNFILLFIALSQFLPINGMAYKFIPDTYQLNPATLQTVNKLGEDAKALGADVKNSTAIISGAVNEGTRNLSQALTTSTTTVGLTVTNATQRICSTVDSAVQSFEKTAGQLRQTTEKTSGDMIKSIDALNSTANKFIDNGVHITVDQQTTQALRELNTTMKPLADKGLQISIDQKTTDAVSQAITTLKPIADNGLKINVDDQTLKALQDLATNGVQAKFSIDPKTIIASCTALGGLTLVAVGAALIYKEFTKPEQTNLQAMAEKQTWKHSLKNFFSSGYVVGTTSIVSGLLLIANSNRIATACV